MGYYYRDNLNTYSKSDKVLSKETDWISNLSCECGIVAVSKIINISSSELLAEIKVRNKSLFTYICKNYKLGLDYKCLIKIILAKLDVVFDLRYNYGKRMVSDYLFESHLTGVTALKFRNNNLTHWCSVIKGKIVDGKSEYESIKEIESAYAKEFDGFGHTFMVKSERDSIAFHNIESSGCLGDCSICMRFDFCKQYSSNFNKTVRSIDI